ncbi:ThiJ/PfpI family protein [Parvularcula bermudensis HTCC2503]|uniref:ThiJ/PfpI family protein n=1 Tax=Parvularcula bermudensis (strain ATCC BAA-594 / HTCC2503 / KCTC 12087) TaxID=314260 RepID=E0TEP9_PARBH|nr:DJ-1/PfpI family protein [Parvularcula bermudensis]ADM08932.1 ThiJ/PfpI family protein [Parvularcula bermudensis HTCC2503]
MSPHVVFLLFPRMTQLDLTGPAEVLSRVPGARLSFVAKTLDPVLTSSGFGILPTATYATVGRGDILCIPGGFGIDDVMIDPESMAFVKDQAAGAQAVTAVCTGALVLGAAGLLRGVRATTHWAFHPLLERTGARPTQARVVQDGRIITGGGVTAGIDFGLTLAATLCGDEAAREIALSIEYDPAPPFGPGTLEGQPDAIGSRVAERYRSMLSQTAARLETALAGG